MSGGLPPLQRTGESKIEFDKRQKLHAMLVSQGDDIRTASHTVDAISENWDRDNRNRKYSI